MDYVFDCLESEYSLNLEKMTIMIEDGGRYTISVGDVHMLYAAPVSYSKPQRTTELSLLYSICDLWNKTISTPGTTSEKVSHAEKQS